MLRDEGRMAPHRRLLPILDGVSGRQPLRDEDGGVIEDGRHTLVCQISALLRPESEAHTEGGSRQSGEEGVEISHPIPI